MRANRESGEHGTENTSSCSGPNGEDYSFVPEDGPIQFKLLGRLIGNAVPVELGRVIGESIIEHVKQHVGPKHSARRERRRGPRSIQPAGTCGAEPPSRRWARRSLPAAIMPAVNRITPKTTRPTRYVYSPIFSHPFLVAVDRTRDPVVCPRPVKSLEPAP